MKFLDSARIADMDTFSTLIEHERKAVAMLRRKLQEREQRLRFLESMPPADKFDLLLEAELTPSAVEDQVEQAVAALVATPTAQTPARVTAPLTVGRAAPKLDERYEAIMEFIGDNTKSIDDVTKFLLDTVRIAPGEEVKVRRFMFELKGKFGLLVSPRRGVYRKKNTTNPGDELDLNL